MKRIGILLFVFAMALTSCSKDEDIQNPLIGSWEHSEILIEGDQLLTLNEDGTGTMVITFKEVGLADVIEITNFNWTTIDGYMIFTAESQFGEAMSYEISGDTLTLIYRHDDGVVYTRQ